jgi:hypothetical protein
MKVNEMFFWALLLAYDDLCKECVLHHLNGEPETVFYRRLIDAVFRIEAMALKEKFVMSVVCDYPILKHVTGDSWIIGGLRERQENKGE